MVDQAADQQQQTQTGHISEADYMQHYAEHGYEWVQGELHKMSPVTSIHQDLVDYLRDLFRTYLDIRPVARLHTERFVMHLELPYKVTRREPDLMLILHENPHTLTDTYMNGPADICIEVVSRGSETVDYGDKLTEYEQGGVREYWIIDPIRQQSTFYRLTDAGHYQRYDVQGDVYKTPLLPDLALHLSTLWQSDLPSIRQVVKAVEAMLADEA